MLYKFFFYIIISLIIEQLYLKIAIKYNIIDKPNERSSHSKITIRGAGILFPIAFLISFFKINDYVNYWPLIIGTIAISAISFLDDIITLKNKYRLAVHFSSVALLLYQVNVFEIQPLYLIPAFILVVGVINSYNFMDGINGIHVLYSIVALGTLYFISETDYSIFPPDVFIALIASLLVFAYFNLRKKAKCFSGDVGSVSIAFIIAYSIILLIIKTEDFRWLLLLGVYGIDSVATIVLRLIRRENIFVAHRSHFYQYLANDRKISHVLISIYYALIQLLINITLLFGSSITVISILMLIVSIYVYMRLALEGKSRLFKKY